MKRKAIGKRAVDLAQELDSTPETISRWENGKAEIESRLSCCWLLWSKIKSEAQTQPNSSFAPFMTNPRNQLESA